MESIYHPAADPELHAPEFVEAVTRFRSAVKEFTAAVDRLDNSIAAAIKVFSNGGQYAVDLVRTNAGETDTEISIPVGYHPPA